MRPIGDRVLIRPEPAPDVSASGLILIAEDKKPEQTGTVVAVGRPVHPRKVEAFEAAENLERGKSLFNKEAGDYEQAAADLLRDLTRREPVVKPGDFVIFSWNVGQEILLNDGDERYLLMREDDILAVVE